MQTIQETLKSVLAGVWGALLNSENSENANDQKHMKILELELAEVSPFNQIHEIQKNSDSSEIRTGYWIFIQSGPLSQPAQISDVAGFSELSEFNLMGTTSATPCLFL